jgi:hypothetical protein
MFKRRKARSIAAKSGNFFDSLQYDRSPGLAGRIGRFVALISVELYLCVKGSGLDGLLPK